MRSLEVGDRVRVTPAESIPFKGRITSIFQAARRADAIFVTEDGFYSSHKDSPFYPHQCRKLVKKHRRRVWCHEEDLHRFPSNLILTSMIPTPACPGRWVEFVEVRKK